MANTFEVAGVHELRKVELSRREKIGQFLINVRKFAIESAITESLKGVNGMKRVYKIVQERFMDRAPALPSNGQNKCEDFALAEEIRAEMEGAQENMTNLKQENMTSANYVDELQGTKKISNERFKGSDLLETERKRVFIRSRL
ncbi:hypothetical protein HS088_TW19G00248 [Tripterygium wilfordii]|uniref:Uncharacterized protein n=1 Tax=Tripterygium wilfordii TaxID=458696 RepID=A0A7J7C9P9_TRIWF|nr:uncharacterized protein LOC119985860 [Tripterygium wilfordii]KAF5730655.1 hypothetical protein HS088_TW19G00248 [Tripterygium wilfordii]